MIGNKYYDEHTPWISVKENIDEFNNTTYTCVYIMNNLSKLLYPFCPKGAKKIRKMGIDDKLRELGAEEGDQVRILDFYFDFKD